MNDPDKVLSDIEWGVLADIACGMENLQIGTKQFRSAETIKNHVANILDKLGAVNRTHAVAIAYEIGLFCGDAVNPHRSPPVPDGDPRQWVYLDFFVENPPGPRYYARRNCPACEGGGLVEAIPLKSHCGDTDNCRCVRRVPPPRSHPLRHSSSPPAL